MMRPSCGLLVVGLLPSFVPTSSEGPLVVDSHTGIFTFLSLAECNCGWTYISSHKSGTMFQYYIQLIPTLFVNSKGETLHTNQFSALKHVKVIGSDMESGGMPGVSFNYELSALMVKISEKKVPLSHLIIDLCSMAGGVWIVCKFIDSFIYSSTKSLMKIELGKAS